MLRGIQDTLPIGASKYTFNYPKHSGVLSWQVNPPNAAHRHESVILQDGDKPIARVDKTLTVFP